jgi:2-polyprenyl-6-methoxyphenol hydroxylase-like FAD-dependent oxidoreductase
VAPKLALEGAKPDAEFLQARLMREEYLRDRFMAAKRIAPVRTASNYSYASSKFSGARWLLAGDAAAFVDPVFSTGVFLGLSSGVRAARAVQRAIEVPASRSELFANYESWLQGFLDTYARFVRGFYEPEFVDLFMHPTRAAQLQEAVTSLLSGYGDDPEVVWRIGRFMNAVRANRDAELSPRIPGRREAKARLLARMAAEAD